MKYSIRNMWKKGGYHFVLISLFFVFFISDLYEGETAKAFIGRKKALSAVSYRFAASKEAYDEYEGEEEDDDYDDYDDYDDDYDDYDDDYEYPDQIVIESAKSISNTSVKLVWQKDNYSIGYEVVCAKDKSFSDSVIIKETTETSYTFENLKRGEIYYFRIRGYGGRNSRNYGSWSEVKAVMLIDASGTVRITTKADIVHLQEVLDQALEYKNIKFIVKLPKGTYKITRRIFVYSNTTLDLKGVTIKREKGYIGPMLRIGALTGGKYNAGKNITIKGGIFDGGTKVDTADICCFSHVQNVTICGTVFQYLPSKKLHRGNRNPHIIEFGGSKKVTIKNCKFYNNKNCFANNEAIQIESMYASMAGTTPADIGKRDGTQCKNITIQKCYFSHFNYGCGSNHLSKKDHFKNMKFIKNTFVYAKKYAICIYGYRNVVIKKNKLRKSGQLVLNFGSKGVKIIK